MTWVCWISLWNTKWHGVALMVLVVTFPLFCRKLLLSLVDFFINQVPVERHTRFIAYSIPPLPWLLFWHKVVICTRQNTYFALHFSYNWVAAENPKKIYFQTATMQMKRPDRKLCSKGKSLLVATTNEALNTLMNCTYRILNYSLFVFHASLSLVCVCLIAQWMRHNSAFKGIVQKITRWKAIFLLIFLKEDSSRSVSVSIHET